MGLISVFVKVQVEMVSTIFFTQKIVYFVQHIGFFWYKYKNYVYLCTKKKLNLNNGVAKDFDINRTGKDTDRGHCVCAGRRQLFGHVSLQRETA